MLKIKIIRKSSLRRALHFAVALLVLVGGLTPLLITRYASAAQLTSRSLTLSQAVPGATSQTYTYGFTTATTAAIQSIEFEACTTAVGTCSGPTGLVINAGTEATRSGWTNATTFTRNATGGGGCTPANNVLCLDRTQAANETAGARTLGWNSQTNPTTANSSFFVRITTYSDTGWTTTVDTGTVAAAVVQTLTVSAYVAEVLNFCVGATSVNDATTSVGATCTNVTGTTVNIGVLDTATTNVSPVDTSLNGNDLNGVAMIRTNAFNGATISLEAIQQSGTNQLGTMRISGATCAASATDYTDQCIRAQGTTQSTFTPSSDERFGMTIAGINCGSTTSYTCTFASGTYNLVRDAAYDGNGANTFVTDENQVAGTTNGGYAWDDSGTSDPIASSTGSTVKVIDDEAMILKFAAYSAITTPFGTYSAQADYIAVATY